MLVLTRKPGEVIVIGDDIEVKVLTTDAYRVKLAITAPKNVSIFREELLTRDPAAGNAFAGGLGGVGFKRAKNESQAAKTVDDEPAVRHKGWWEILGVSPQATREEIQRAHRALAMEHHPDKGGDPTVMTEINLARDQGLEELP